MGNCKPKSCGGCSHYGKRPEICHGCLGVNKFNNFNKVVTPNMVARQKIAEVMVKPIKNYKDGYRQMAEGYGKLQAKKILLKK